MKMVIQKPIRLVQYGRYDSIRFGEKPLQRRGFQALPFRYGRYGIQQRGGTLVPSLDRIVSSVL
jgi:hypothetical protein